MYLHGGSRRGDDIEKLRNVGWGLPAVVENDVFFPFVVLSPQCPEGEIWTDSEALAALLDEIIQKYSIDSKRVYLTGHSMGGRGTWYLAYKYPERFAAIAPMSGASDITWAQRLKHMPIWAFHGRDDQTVPISETEAMVRALRVTGNVVRFTQLTGRGHDILDIYKDQELYRWFLKHSL
jgi:predicted peptidase